MKMNAKKLSLVLLALLLALTCVFVACGNKEEEKKEETVNVDVVAVAEQFKKDYADNYLDLYTAEVAAQLNAAEAEAILKITAAKTTDDAKAIAKTYIDALKAAKTLVDEVKALITKIGDVALADEPAINTMKAYDAQLQAAIDAGATGARKTLLDKYAADTATRDAIDEIVARFAALKVAKDTADKGINAKIAAMIAKFQDEDAKLTMGDYTEQLALVDEFDAFAAEHDLEKGSDAYKEILDEAGLAQTATLFAQRTADDKQIQRAIAVINAAKALKEAADAARVNSDESVWVDGSDLTDKVATIYYMDINVFYAGAEYSIPADGLTLRMTSVAQGESRWVNPDDVYPSVQAANDDNIWDIIEVKDPRQTRAFAQYTEEVEVDGQTMYAKAVYETREAAEEAGVRNPLEVTIPTEPAYRLDLQDDVEEAAAVAEEWYNLIDQAGTLDLEENATVKAFYDQIEGIVAAYNESLEAAIAAFNEFAGLLVVPNYVDEMPGKPLEYAEYVLNDEAKTLVDEIEDVRDSAITSDDETNDDIFVRIPTFRPDGEYDYAGTGKVMDGEELVYEGPVFVDAHKNEDGSYSPAIFYKTWAYKYKIDGQYIVDGQAQAPNTFVLDPYAILAQYAYNDNTASYAYDMAKAFVEWAKTYIGEDLPATFDLTPYQTVGTEDTIKFVCDVMTLTFEDYSTEEVAVPQVIKIMGKDAPAASAADNKTVYADYSVALAIIAEQERLEAEREANIKAIDEAVIAIFKATNPEALKNVLDLYNAAVKNSYLALTEADLNAYLAEESALTRLVPADEDLTYREIVLRALALVASARNLYPIEKWDDELEVYAEVLEDAEDALEDTVDAYEEFVDLLNDAKADLEYKKIGVALNGRGATFFTDDDVAAAQKKVDVLTQWEFIFKNASKAFTENVEFASQPDYRRNPAYLTKLVAGVVDEDALAEELAVYVDDDEVLDEMVAILADAASIVEYIDEAGNVHTFDGKRTMLDLKGRQKTVDEAQAAYDAAVAEFKAEFKLYADGALDDEAGLDTFIAQLGDFLAAYGLVTERDEDGEIVATEGFDYVNLFVKNPYTEEYIDLFSFVFNAKVLARYGKSIELTLQYAAEEVDALNGNTDCLTDTQMAALFQETSWYKAAWNLLDTKVVDETYTKYEDGVAAVEDAYFFTVDKDDARIYDWAVYCMNYSGQIADDADFVDVADLLEYLKTAVINEEP